MNTFPLRLICVILLLPQGSRLAAGNPLTLLRQLGDLIDTMSVSSVDRRYIDAPEKPWQLIVKGNVNQSSMEMETSGSIGGHDYKASPYLENEPTRYVGVWGGYRGYGLGYSVNVGGDKGSYLTFGATGAWTMLPTLMPT